MATFSHNPQPGDFFRNKTSGEIIKILKIEDRKIRATRVDPESKIPFGSEFSIFQGKWGDYEPVMTSHNPSDNTPGSPSATKLYSIEIDDNGQLVIKQDGKVVGATNVRGPQGDPGKPGEKGPRGDLGIQGPPGVPGIDGNTWTPRMTDDKTGIYFINNDGTTTEVYPVKGDRGDKGDPGLPGDVGERGEQGAPGVNGKNGDTWVPEVSADGESLYFKNSQGEVRGPYAIRGAQGSQGIQGPKGEPGAKGDQGEQGARGADAETWTPVVSDDGETLQFISNKGNKSPVFQIRGPQGKQGLQGIPGIKGDKGNTFTPHYDGEWLWFEDENGNKPFPPTHVKGVKGEKGDRGKSAFELWRDDPLHPENATKTLDDFLESLKGEDGKVVNTYHNELTELTDYTCPIQEINPYMIVSSDSLEGAETAEQTIAVEKAKIDKIRAEGEKYVNHGSWIQEFFWWCAGADRALLRMCPGDHSKYMGIGTVIFFTALMAWFSSFVALGLVTGESTPGYEKPLKGIILPVVFLLLGGLLAFLSYKRYKLKRKKDASKENASLQDREKKDLNRFEWKFIVILILLGLLILGVSSSWFKGELRLKDISWAAFFACAWSLMIFFLDRFITNTMYSDGKVTISWLELRSALPRIIIAIFLGIVISAPLELIIFKKAVNLRMENQIQKEKDQYVSNATASAEKEFQTKLTEAQNAYNKADRDYLTAEGQYNEFINIRRPTATVISSGTKIDANGNPKSYTILDDSEGKKYDETKDELLNDKLRKDTLRNKAETYLQGLRASRDTLIEKAKTDAQTKFDENVDKGLKRQLSALHSIAYLDSDGNEIPENDNPNWGWVFAVILCLSFAACSPFLQNVTVEKENDKYPPFTGKNWWKGFLVVVPWLAALSFAIGYCYNIVFFSLPCYIFSSVGMIMMLFILIDVSPVFYKMMLADGVYDKILHKEKLLAQDAMRLSAAKAYAKVNDSSIGRLTPFVFGETSKKIFNLLKDFKLKSAEIDIDENGRPEMGYGKTQEHRDIEASNREVFEYVLSLKMRLVKAAHLAWYRDMRDHILATKEDPQTPPEQPEDIFPEYDDESAPAISIELSQSDFTLHIGENETLTAKITPDKYADMAVSWESDNETVATVDESGVISAITPGVAKITAKCGTYSASCTLTIVENHPTKIQLATSEVSLKVGENATLEATISPSGSEYNASDIIWTSDDEGIVSVDKDADIAGGSTAKITANNSGETKVRVKYDELEASCIVNVPAPETEGADEDEDAEHEITDNDFKEVV